jgi:DNA primase
MEMTMPQQYIDFAFVKANASFEAVLAHYNMQATGSGKDRAVLCPFHKERKPLCKIELERKIFHCFGCEAKGNILEFVARLEGDEDDLRAAAIKIAELCDIAVAPPRISRGSSQSEARRRRRRAAKAWSDDAASARRSPQPDATTADANLSDGVESVAAESAEAVNPPLTFALKLDPTHPYLKARGL